MTVPKEKLSEKDFVQNGKFPFWVWIFLLILLIGVLSQFFIWYRQDKNPIGDKSPFYRVTNREMSLFYWQNPHFLQIQEGWQNIDTIDQIAIVSPELLFRYHTWNRLLRDEFDVKSIDVNEFLKFLASVQEWQPVNWPNAPEEYRLLVPELPKKPMLNLASLSYDVLPREVRIAFQGWWDQKNYSKKIEEIQPTYLELDAFLKEHPNYARNFWRNLFSEYLESTLGEIKDPAKAIPVKEVPLFLKLAIFNWERLQNPLP